MSQARNRGSPSDTPEHVLQNMLRAAKVTQVFVEALKTGNEMADQNKRQMGKNKNHWVLRVLIETPYVAGNLLTQHRSRPRTYSESPRTSTPRTQCVIADKVTGFDTSKRELPRCATVFVSLSNTLLVP